VALERLAASYLAAQRVMDRISRRYRRAFLQALLDLPPVPVEMLDDEQALQAWVDQAQARLNAAGEAAKVGYDLSIEPAHEGDHRFHLRLQIREHGTLVSQVIGDAFFASKEYRQIAEAAAMLEGLLESDARVQRGDKTEAVTSFGQALDWLMHDAKRGLTIQRYKGLGEMNPEQLWETTMNPETRRLLQVTVKDAMLADEVFTTLMGDAVEPRRAFIEENALAVENLDV
ncbi:MAG TPA: DNA gyrase subunit B, partial [Piscirickettsiaceae bacterium]|nr:DNA gyrase subunit B [Piscirickettsiaceae bacterium]